MNNATLVGLMMLVVGGCAREAVVAASPAAPAHSVSPYAHLESVGLWRDCDGHCGAPGECIDRADKAFYESGGSDAAYEAAVAQCAQEPDDYENECQVIASREWNKARNAKYHRSPESAKAAADEAYEDTYTRCVDAHCEGFCDAPVSAPANEDHCMAVAELAYERAAGYEMTALGDAPVPDAAYENAYASCTDGH